MKTTAELLAALDMVKARLESTAADGSKLTAEEWRIIERHLRQGADYAAKCAKLRALLDANMAK